MNLYDKLKIKNGLEKQLIVAIEELSELQKEITKHLRGIGNRQHIEEEVADVEIVVDELKYFLDLDKRNIERIKKGKLGLMDTMMGYI